MTQEPPYSEQTPPGPPVSGGNPYDPSAPPAWGGQQPSMNAGPYPAPNYYGHNQYAAPAVRRPGTVIAGGVIAIVMSALTGFVMLVFTIFADSLLDEIGLDDVGDAFVAIGLIFVALSILGIFAAARAMAGSQAWRIVLVVFGSIITLLGFIGIFDALASGDAGAIFGQLLWTAGAGVSVLFMFINGANEWFDSKQR